MIDAGISYKQIKEKLEKIGFSPSSIKKIFITHEHIDHIKGLKVLLKNNPDIELYMHEKSYKVANEKFDLTNVKINFINNEDIIKHEYLRIKPIEGSHDSFAHFTYALATPNFQIFHATDIGNVSMKQRDVMQTCNFVLLESNYDFQMLRSNTKYPIKTKERIHSNTGHLMNEDATKVINKLDNKVTKFVCLAHLSENNNTREKVIANNAHLDLNIHVLHKDEIVSINLEDNND